MVKALIATAILSLALIFGGYALEQTRTPSATAKTEHAEKYDHGCTRNQKGDDDSGRGSIGHGDRQGNEQGEDQGGRNGHGRDNVRRPPRHGRDNGFSRPAPSHHGWR